MQSKLRPFAQDYLNKMIDALDSVKLDEMNQIVDLLWQALEENQTVFFVGNGGSASTATHLAADLAKNTILKVNDSSEHRFKCLSLTDNPAWITALSNDISYNDIFVEQLKNLSKPNDLVIFITGSGNSGNLIKAALWAKQAGLTTAGLLAFDGGYLKPILDYSVMVPVNDYGIAESVHSAIHHYLVEAIKKIKND